MKKVINDSIIQISPMPAGLSWRRTPWVYTMASAAHGWAIRLLLFASWLGLVLFLSWHHAVWRDEVRALSLALQGENFFTMLRGIHGEGHPAVWYLLLRGAHTLVARPEVLQIVALIVASAAFLLLLLRSHFSLLVIALVLVGRISIFEYSVIARNYGISMLLLFMVAAFYEQHRDRGLLIGALLFMLANFNAHSVLLVGSFLLFWLVDIATDDGGVPQSRALKTFLLNAAIAILGVAICLLTIFPTFNDAVLIDRPSDTTFKLLLKAISLPTLSFDGLMLHLPQSAMEKLSLWTLPHFCLLLNWLSVPIMSLIIIGSTFGLARWPAAFLAALVALIAFSLFFNLIYPGEFRHQALWVVFLISMYWIMGCRFMQREPAIPRWLEPLIQPVSRIGSMLFLVLLALQVPVGINRAAGAAGNNPPFSRSRDLGTLVMERHDLQDAIIIADPDYLVLRFN